MDPLVTVWNGTTQIGPVGSLLDLQGTVQANGDGSATLTVESGNRRVEALGQPGARATIDWPTPDGMVRLMSGPVDSVKGGQESKAPTRTFRVDDDWFDLWNNIVYPNPDGTDAQQGDKDAYYVSSGALETVVLDLIRQSLKKTGNDVVVPASQGRGPQVKVSMRCHKLLDRLLPYVKGSGLLFRVVQDDSDGKPHVVVSEPATQAMRLTAASGVLRTNTWGKDVPTVNTVVVMAGGEGTARKIKTYTYPDAVSACGGVVRQAVVDARDLALDDPALADLMQQRADEAAAEGAVKVGVNMNLTETGWFRLGKAYGLGSPVTIVPVDGPELADSVRQIQFSIKGGPKLTPIVGEWSDDTTTKWLIRKVTAVSHRLTNVERSV